MTCAVIRGVELTGRESSADISGSYRIIQGSMIRHYPEFKKKKKGFAHDVSDILTLHSSYCTWIILACPGRCKTCDMSMRRSSLEIHWSATVATGIVSPSNFHFPSTAHYGKWISNTQQPWSETRTRPMRPSCSVREEQALCSKSHLVLHSSTLCLTEPIPSYQHHKAPQHLACVPSVLCASVHIHHPLKLWFFRYLEQKKTSHSHFVKDIYFE